LVVGDIPPLAFAAAARAGVKALALGNFTWDWIYGNYPAFEALAPDVVPTMRAAYAAATRALRLPFHGGFEPMAAVTGDIPLIAQEDLLAGDWAGAISALLAQPDPPDRARVDGAAVAAAVILSF